MIRRVVLVMCLANLAIVQPVSSAQENNQTWQALDAKVTELYSTGDLPQAIDAAQAALKSAASPRESGRSLDRLGFLYYTSGNLADGETYLRHSLRLRESAFGADSLDYAETANDLAMLLRDLRRMDEARVLAERAVASRERLLGDHTQPLAESLNTLATVYAMSGEYGTAVSQFERALAIHEERAVSDRATEEYGTLCVNLAGTYQRLGKYEAAELTFRKGLDALRVKPGVQHPAYAASEVAYAALEVDLGHYVDAERLYNESERLVKAELGDQHPVYAALLNNRGFFFQSIGNLAAAESDYQRSLEVKRKLYGPASAPAISTLRNLAHLIYARDHRQGEQLFAEAADGFARMTNAPAFDFASVLVGLARAERDRGALSEAHATAMRAVEISRKGLGEQHPLFASATREVGLTLAATGNDAEAERELRDALAIAERVHGSSHPDVAPFLDALGDVSVKRKDFVGAYAMYARSIDIQDRFWSDVLNIGSESFKTASILASPDPLPRLIAFQAAAPQLPAARELAFEAVTRRKGRIIEQVRNWRDRLEASESEAIRRKAQEWRSLLQCRTSLTVALGYRDLKPSIAGSCTLPGTDIEGLYERLLSDLRSRWSAEVGAKALRAIDVLQQRADALETSLNREAGAPIASKPATLDDVRRDLADDEALIEFVSFAGGGKSSNEAASRRYGAFVVAKPGTLGWVDLGSAGPIDASVNDLLSAARDWSISLANHETEAARATTETARTAIADLSRRVWRPLKPIINSAGVTHLRVAPDAMLNLVPFEALADGRELIEQFTITYVPAGRDVTASSSGTAMSAPVVVVSPGSQSRPPRAMELSGTSFRADGLAPLSAAAEEAADVRRLVPRAELYAGAAASERNVKELHGPSLLHIVGHGVVRGGQDCGGDACVSTSLDPSTQAMSLAAIVLEEAYGRSAGSSDDGLLTALELQNMDLRGTEMLVLSQCQMAGGFASVGESVYGMRRAAIISGVHTFVAPLWNVEDGVQRRLMKNFYERLAAGESRADALRHAKLALRRLPATNSFLYWAPVIMSGSSSPVPSQVFHR
jgi:CHAT domain-containing protein/tetratricopeptide (TPR) repeat protein